MKIIAISDTHLTAQRELTEKLLACHDTGEEFVLVHAGDALNYGSLEEAHEFLFWFAQLPFKYKIFVPGNHDHCFDLASSRYKKITPQEVAAQYPSVRVLINEVVEIEGMRFAGVCAIPDLRNWAFYATDLQRKRIFDVLPPVDVLINHAPFAPFKCAYFVYKGCEYARAYAVANSVQAYICGHIHEDAGYSRHSDVHCYNAAVLDEQYKGCREPLILEVLGKEKTCKHTS